MSTVFILREDVIAFLAATDNADKLTAYQTIVKNASVDIKLTNSANSSDVTGIYGPRISIFLEDLGHVYPKKTFLDSPSKTLAALQRLFNAYMTNSSPINPGAIGSDMNPTCRPPGQQDTEEYLVECIFNKISPPLDIYTITENSSLQCSIDNKEYSNDSTTTGCLNIQVAKDLTNSVPINMIEKLIEYTTIEKNHQQNDPVNTLDNECSDDIIQDIVVDGKPKKLLTSSSRQKKLTIQNNKNTYMILSLKILFTLDKAVTYNKYAGKITIPSSFYINTAGEFSNAGPGTQYTLLGFTAHYGGWSGGHYVYYKKIKKDGTDNWVKISDEIISAPMSETDALIMKDGGSIQCKDFLYIKTDKQDAYFAKPIVTKGFVNSTGSLCYMNSMNQLLLSMPEFVDYIQKLPSETSSTPIRVVSYNILTTEYAAASVVDDDKYKDNDARYAILENKLKIEIGNNSIICLQEVSTEWKPKLEGFFKSNNYTIHISNYYCEKPPSTKCIMGVAIAHPNTMFAKIKGEPIRDTKPAPTPASTELYWMNLRDVTKDSNIILHAAFSLTSSGETLFSVSTYHMPSPTKITNNDYLCIHASLAAQAAEKYANGKPYILCGDFNTTPTNPAYDLLTSGKLPTSVTINDEFTGDTWKPTFTKLISAYVKLKGKNQDFTIAGQQIRKGKILNRFEENIDYIFLSDKWNVKDVLIHSLPAGKNLPNASEPSDHVMIGATLSLD